MFSSADNMDYPATHSRITTMADIIDRLQSTDLDPELEKILDNFSSLFDIRIAYFKPNGTEYMIGKNKKLSSHCEFLRERLHYKNRCLTLDKAKQYRARNSRKIQYYRCHGGCYEAIKPLYYGDELTGYIMMGQASCQKNVPDPIIQDARKAGIIPDIIEAFNDLPNFTSDKMDAVMQLFSELTDLIILKKLIKQNEQGPVKQLVDYMETVNPGINLKQAASLVHLSEDRLRHKIKEDMGRTFTELRNSICMGRACKLLIENRELSIQDIAYESGFSDPQYFSRAFKKHTGFSPSLFAANSRS
jgi:AraC-like DNA-binding protein